MKNRVAALRAERGWSQARLAEMLSVSRQTVNALELAKSDPGLALAMRVSWLFNLPVESIFLADLDERMVALGEPWEQKARAATAFNEVAILARLGADGWEMIGFGINALQFRRPQNPKLHCAWTYERVKGPLTTARRAELENDGWLYCGSWMGVFHYFKREAQLKPAKCP
ncbi:MAG: helix-turn-helix transcriptional regulator [Terracidiphilus sp.]|jgi:putative transcriptional regulator